MYGIAVKLFKVVEGEIHIHPDTLNNLPRNEKGWIVFKATANTKKDRKTSHRLTPLTSAELLKRSA